MENAPVQKSKTSGLAIAALIIGIVALATSFLPIINNASFFIAIIGLILSVVAIVSIRKSQNSGMGLSVASLVIAIAAIAIVLGSQAMYSAALDSASKELDKMSGDATEQVLSNDVDVTMGTYSISKGEYGLINSELPVTVKNLMSESKTFNIQIEAVDASGSRIATDYIYASSLGAGQSQTFKAFEYIPSDDFEAMKGATFNVVSVNEF